MMQSMTGFGSAEKGVFKAEIRSLNHRFLDISIKIPQNLSRHEMELRSMVKERFSRGRFDAMVSVSGAEALKLKINTSLARDIYDSLRAIKDELSLSGEIGIDTIAGFSNLISTEEVEYNTESLYSAFEEALEHVKHMRRSEGDAISKDLFSKLDILEMLNGQISHLCSDSVNRCKDKFMERLNLLLGDVKFDDNRVLQEAAVMADRTDISEETMRITSHIGQIKKIIQDGDTIGRRLEFILQELNREVNTIASKSGDYKISSLIVEMKSELEKMREQAQNIQ